MTHAIAVRPGTLSKYFVGSLSSEKYSFFFRVLHGGKEGEGK